MKQLSDNRENEVIWTLPNEKDARNFLFLLRSALRQIEMNDTGPYKGIYGMVRSEGAVVTFTPKNKFKAVFTGIKDVTSIPEIKTFTDLFLISIPDDFVNLELPYLELKDNELETFKEWVKMKNLILLNSHPYMFKKSS